MNIIHNIHRDRCVIQKNNFFIEEVKFLGVVKIILPKEIIKKNIERVKIKKFLLQEELVCLHFLTDAAVLVEYHCYQKR